MTSAGVEIDVDDAGVGGDRPATVALAAVRERCIEGRVGIGVTHDVRGEFGVGDAPRRHAGDVDVAVDDLDVGGVGFEHLGRFVEHLLADLPRGELQRAAADGPAAAPAGPEQSERGAAGVAEDDLHVLDRHAQLVRDDLAVRRLVALTVRHL